MEKAAIRSLAELLKLSRRYASLLAGECATRKFAGSGFEFDSLRVYHEGDDVRRIDWSSSARADQLMVRSYKDQQKKTFCILIDCSLSLRAGSTEILKRDLARELATILLHAIEANADAFGLIAWDGARQVYAFLQPRAMKGQAARADALVTDLLQNTNKQSAFSLLEDCLLLLKNNVTIFCITDGIIKDYERVWSNIRQRASLSVLRVRDRYEATALPRVTMDLYDAEKGEHCSYFSPVDYDALMHAQKVWYDNQEKYAQNKGIVLADFIAGAHYEQALHQFLVRSSRK